MRITESSIRRPVFAVMLIGGIVVLGLVSIPKLGIDLWPRLEFPIVTVTTRLPGAAPETVESEVTEILEEAVNTIEGLRSLRSSSSQSVSRLFIEFGLEYDVQVKAQLVREKVSAVLGDLPTDVEPPIVERVDPDASPILVAMLAGPYSIRAISEIADKQIVPRLEGLPGVGSVSLVGSRPREIRLWIDPIRLSGYGLAVDDVVGAVRRAHVELPGGLIETSRSEYTLKTESKLSSAMEFGDIVVARHKGRVVHLSEVATVEDGMAEERSLSRLDGQQGVALEIRRQSGENTVRVADAVLAELDRIRPGLPQGFEMIVARDSSRFVRSAVREVAFALMWGSLLAGVIVFVFLQNGRSTAITAVAIPSSLIGSFAFFYLLGFTINSMTLMALSLSIGILIDDAIVVLENIHRHIERGVAPLKAASQGTAEIGLAVIATTLAICAVFIPIAFLSGVVGRFFREFGLVAAAAVSISTLVALTVTPMLCSRFIRIQRSPSRAVGWMQAPYLRLERVYRRALAWGLAHRAAVVILALAFVGGGVVVASAVPVEFTSSQDRSEFNVWLKMPLGSTLQQTATASALVEERLEEIPSVRAVFASIGAGARKRVNETRIYVQLSEKAERSETQHELMSDVRALIEGLALPLDEFSVEEIPIVEVGGARNAQLMYSIRGPEIGRLQFFANNLLERMREAGGYADLNLSYEFGNPEIALEITRERAADLGVSADAIGRTISALFSGIIVTSFEDEGERHDVVLQIRPQDRDEVGELALVRVRSQGGSLVPLGNLVTPSIGYGPVQIDREDRSRGITIYANFDGKAAGTADVEIERFAANLGIGGEYSFAPVGPSKRLRETGEAIGFAFLLALIAIYMILAAQFNSFIHPFTIMLSAPLSFPGAFLALWITGASLNVMSQIAFLMLMGIVMKNGILLVDYTNTLRSRGRSTLEAVLEAGPTRMRPVLMTAVSTIFGMLPVVLSSGDGSEVRSPMGIIAIGGLSASTLLTLIVVPVVYTLVDDAQSALLALGRRTRIAVTGKSRAPQPGSKASV